MIKEEMDKNLKLSDPAKQLKMNVERFGDFAEQYSIESSSRVLRGEVPPIQHYGVRRRRRRTLGRAGGRAGRRLPGDARPRGPGGRGGSTRSARCRGRSCAALWSGRRLARRRCTCTCPSSRRRTTPAWRRTDARPPRLLAEHGRPGTATTAVHATHLTAADIDLLGASRTTVCLCPTTERDLADGIGPARALAAAGARLSLGSDSNAVIDLWEEARAVELDERLAHAAPRPLAGRGAGSGGDRGRPRVAGLAGGGPTRSWGAGRPGPSAWTSAAGTGWRLGARRRGHRCSTRVFAATAADVPARGGRGPAGRRGGRHLLVDDVPAVLGPRSRGGGDGSERHSTLITTSGRWSPTTRSWASGPRLHRRRAGHATAGGWPGPARRAAAPAADDTCDAAGRAVLPGFVDSHAHLVFAGDRAAEFASPDGGRAVHGRRHPDDGRGHPGRVGRRAPGQRRRSSTRRCGRARPRSSASPATG